MDLMEVDVINNNIELQVEKQEFAFFNIENESDLLVEVQPNDFLIIKGCS